MKERSKARRFAVQAIYQWLLTGQDLTDIENQFFTGHDMGKTDVNYFREILHFVGTHKTSLSDHMFTCLNRPFKEVDPVEQAILLIGAYELQERPEVPYRVVINEAIEQAKTFGAEDGHKFVNGILDKVAGKLRAVEISAKRR